MAVSLKNISVSIILIGLFFTIFSLLVSEGANNYDVEITGGFEESFDTLNQSLIQEYDETKERASFIKDITGSSILEGAYLGGSTIIKILKSPADSLLLAYSILNEFALVLGINEQIMIFFEAMILISLAWLTLYAIRRYREDR